VSSREVRLIALPKPDTLRSREFEERAMSETSELLKAMYRDYAVSVGLSPNARYLHGTPLCPVVPLDVATGGLFILGAYPSARFCVVDGISDVPVADNLGPFESERWFDGSRVREQPSARELRDYFLSPLAIERSSCWITDLVKVFLFKPGHVERYQQLRVDPPAGYVRERFIELARLSIPWIERELTLARPRLLITLGAEVAGVLRGVDSTAAQTRLLEPLVSELTLGSTTVPAIHCAHPGILMRPQARNPWPDAHRNNFLPAIQAFLKGCAA
jgi:uracil-DNA glycosylase